MMVFYVMKHSASLKEYHMASQLPGATAWSSHANMMAHFAVLWISRLSIDIASGKHTIQNPVSCSSSRARPYMEDGDRRMG